MNNILISATILSSLLGGFSNAALIAAYDFEEGSGPAIDGAGGDDNGTLGAGATYVGSGAPGNGGNFAMDFNGTSTGMVNLGTGQDLLNSAPGVTLAAWVNADALTATTQHLIHISVGAAGNASQTRALLRFNAGAIQAGGRSSDTETFRSRTTATFATLGLVQGQWFHLAAVLDYPNADIHIYLNGELISSNLSAGFAAGAAGAANSLASGFGAGFDSGGSPNTPYDGRLDNVRIYNEALNASQIAALIPEPGSALLAFCGAAFLFPRRRN